MKEFRIYYRTPGVTSMHTPVRKVLAHDRAEVVEIFRATDSISFIVAVFWGDHDDKIKAREG